MCIRDRAGRARLVQLRPVLEPAGRPAGRLRAGGRPAAAVGCLLYTSDADDDLPCVDLGGRRVIKQKKTKQQKKNNT